MKTKLIWFMVGFLFGFFVLTPKHAWGEETVILKASAAKERSANQLRHLREVHIEELTRVCNDKIRQAIHEGEGWTYVNLNEYTSEEYNPVQTRLEANGYLVRIHQGGGRHMHRMTDMSIYWNEDDFKRLEE